MHSSMESPTQEDMDSAPDDMSFLFAGVALPLLQYIGRTYVGGGRRRKKEPLPGRHILAPKKMGEVG